MTFSFPFVLVSHSIHLLISFILPPHPCVNIFTSTLLLCFHVTYLLLSPFLKASLSQWSLPSFFLVSISTPNWSHNINWLIYTQENVVFVFLCLSHLTKYNFSSSICLSVYLQISFSSEEKKFQCIFMPHFYCPFISWWASRLISLSSYCEHSSEHRWASYLCHRIQSLLSTPRWTTTG